jgi:hypothetical protein
MLELEVFDPYEPAITPVLESVTDVPNGLSTAPAPPETRMSDVVEVNDPPDPDGRTCTDTKFHLLRYCIQSGLVE